MPVTDLFADGSCVLHRGDALAVLAAQLGLRSIGIDASAEYLRMAEERIRRAARPATSRSAEAGEAPLFDASIARSEQGE